ncbi:AfsR/SARP family transcriptional regulator [Nocardia sp. IFM 10818]
MLIAVAGLAPGSGVSTTALAVAALWPGSERVIVLEADPRGGSLAHRCGGDPERGLASLTAAAGETGVLTATDLEPHLQHHPSGIAYLAAPTEPERVLEALARPISCDPTLAQELVVIADCGLADAAAATAPLLAHANLLLLVARAGELVPSTIDALTNRYPRSAVVLLGDTSITPRVDLDAAILGWLPYDESVADTLLDGRIPLRRNSVVAAAQTLAAAVHVRVGAVLAPPVARGWTPWRRGVRTRRHRAPRVYAINHASLGQTSARLAVHRPHPSVAASIPVPQPSEPPVAEPVVRSEPLVPQADTVLAPYAPLAAEPADPAPMVTVELFGPLRVTWRASRAAVEQSAPGAEITVPLQRRSRELLALLALHPEGLTRAQLIDTMWRQRCPNRPTNALHTALGRLRTAFADASGGTAVEIVLSDSGRYRLDSTRVAVDYTAFTDALASLQRAATDTERRDACERTIGLAAAGTLACDLEADWLEPIRQHARQEALAAVGALAQILVIDDPRATLRLLRIAVGIAPHNEYLYHDMMRLHARLGEHHAIADTLALLTHRLADIGEKPSRETRDIALQLHPKRTRIRNIEKKQRSRQ